MTSDPFANHKQTCVYALGCQAEGEEMVNILSLYYHIVSQIFDEMGIDGEPFASSLQNVRDLKAMTPQARLEQILRWKKEVESIRGGEHKSQSPNQKLLDEIENKKVIAAASYSAAAELAAMLAVARTDFEQKLRERFKDPDTIQSALDIYDRTMFEFDKKGPKQ